MDDTECLICFEDLDSQDKAVLSCNHVIHYSCLQKWMNKKKDIKKLCPICNKDGEIINIIDAQPIYNSETNITEQQSRSQAYRQKKLKTTFFGCCNIL